MPSIDTATGHRGEFNVELARRDGRWQLHLRTGLVAGTTISGLLDTDLDTLQRVIHERRVEVANTTRQTEEAIANIFRVTPEERAAIHPRDCDGGLAADPPGGVPLAQLAAGELADSETRRHGPMARGE